jgi:DNA-binding beta-propeller fold protein YncE
MVDFLWASRGGEAGLIYRAMGVWVAPDGKVWVADEMKIPLDSRLPRGRFFIFDEAGSFLEIWGRPGKGPGEFDFGLPSLLFLPDGSFYVADADNNRVQRFDAARRYRGEWGSGDGTKSKPTGLALAPGGELLVAFHDHPELQRFSLAGKYLGKIDLGLRDPAGLLVDEEGRIWVAMAIGAYPDLRAVVRVFGADGSILAEHGQEGPDEEDLKSIAHLASDGRGHVFVPDMGHSRVVVLDRNAKPVFRWGRLGTAEGQFMETSGIAFDARGAAYVGDWQGGRVQKFSVAGLPEG